MSTLPRFSGAVNVDNTGNRLTHDYQAPAYAATINVAVAKAKTLVKVGQLTGALTVNIGVATQADATPPFVGDEVTFLFTVDGTNRTVTFGTGFSPSATLALTASKKGSASFRYDGATFVETGRAVTA